MPAPEPPPPLVPGTAQVPAVPPKPVYRGDMYGLKVWFGCAIILVLLQLIDAVYWLLQR
jgi:hypothetical protein